MRPLAQGATWLRRCAQSPRQAADDGKAWVHGVGRLSWVLLAVGLVAATVFAFEWRGTVEGQDQRAADVVATEVQARLSAQLSHIADQGATVGALVSLDPGVTNGQFASWLGRTNGAQGSASADVVVQAFVERVPAGQLPGVEARLQASPVFPGWPLPPFTLNPAGSRPTYCLLTLGALNLPPLVQAHRATIESAVSAFDSLIRPGTDMCDNNARDLLFWSALSASTSAQPLGQVVAMIGSRDQQVVERAVNALFGRLSPFFELTPVYSTPTVPTTAAARMANIEGWVLTVIDTQPMLGPVVESQPGLAVSLSYRNSNGAPTQLVSSGTPTGPSLHRTVMVGAGNRWIAEVTIPIESALTPNEEGAIVGFGTLVLALLLFALVRVLATSRAQALLLVEQTAGALEHQARHDALTGLANRSLVIEELDEALARARSGQGSALALLVIDLDAFKDVNDAFGHAVGDELLQAEAGRLVEMMGPTSVIGRLGGDEFVIMVDGAPGDDPEQLAKSVIGALSLPVRLPSVPGLVSVTASIGIATGLRASARDLLRDADIALYEAKSEGKNRYAVFRSEMRTAVLNRFDLESELRTAMRSSQFFLVYQPTFDLEGMGVTGVEALLRWHHPTRGIVPPMDFVPVLESSGMIVDVGRWALAEACRQVRLWHNEGYPVSVAVNVSGRQFEGSNLVQDVRSALVRSGLDPHALVIEITETVLMRDPTAIADRLRQIKQLGVRVAIDDFGTGYSSMAYLQQFPVDILKIDRSFVTGMVESSEGAALVRALVQLGKALGLTTLAEGIEDEVQLYRLRAEKCDAGQGYLFAKPLSAPDAERFMAQRASGGPPLEGGEPPHPGIGSTTPTTMVSMPAPAPAPAGAHAAAPVPAAGGGTAPWPRPSAAPSLAAPSFTIVPAGRGVRPGGPNPYGKLRPPIGSNGHPAAATGAAAANGAAANGAAANGGAASNGAAANGAAANGVAADGAAANGVAADGAASGGAASGGAATEPGTA